MSDRTIRVLWPDGPRYVTKEWVRIQAFDSYYNNADWYRCLDCGENSLSDDAGCDHENDYEPVYNDGRKKPEDLHACKEWLMDKGEVTFGKERVSNG